MLQNSPSTLYFHPQEVHVLRMSARGALTTHNANGSVLNDLAHYQMHSRLHFIGSWKLKAEELLRRWLSVPQATDLQEEHRRAYPWMRGYMHGFVDKTHDLSLRGDVFIHVDMDAFFCSVALSREVNAGLRMMPVAAAIGTGNSEITSCNYVARAMGVRAGAYVGEVRRTICPGLQVVPYDLGQCMRYGEHTYRLMYSLVPLINCRTLEIAFGVEVDPCMSLREEELSGPGGRDWRPLIFTFEVVSVDDTMLSFGWPEMLRDIFQASCTAPNTFGIKIRGGPAIPEFPYAGLEGGSGELETHLQAVVFAVAASYGALFRRLVIAECGGISASCGIGGSYMVSRLATQHAKPNGTMVVLPPVDCREEIALEVFFETPDKNADIPRVFSHPLWDSMESRESPEHSSWRVPHGVTLAAQGQFRVLGQDDFLNATRVSDLFGVGHQVLQKLYALYRATERGQDVKVGSNSRKTQVRLSFLRGTPSILREGFGGLSDDAAACLLVFGPEFPLEVGGAGKPVDARDFTCRELRRIPLTTLQSALGRRSGMLFYCFSRGLDLRELIQTGVRGSTASREQAVHVSVEGGMGEGTWGECCRGAYRDARRYLGFHFFTRDEAAASSITTTMGYACRPQHMGDIRHIVRQLLADVMLKVLARRFPSCKYKGALVPCVYEAFQSFRLVFHHRHPDYQREPHKYLGLGRCLERAFNVRIMVDSRVESAIGDPFRICLAGGGFDEVIGWLDSLAGWPCLYFQGAFPISEDAKHHAGMKRDRNDTLDSGREGTENWRRGKGRGPNTVAAVVILTNPVVQGSIDGNMPIDGRTVTLYQTQLSHHPPMPPGKLGVVPISICSLRRLRDLPSEEGDEPFGHAASWLDAVTDGLCAALSGVFRSDASLGLETVLGDDIPLSMDIGDVRGMALSITGLRTTEDVAVEAGFPRSESSFTRLRPSRWVAQSVILRQRFSHNDRNPGVAETCGAGVVEEIMSVPSDDECPTRFDATRIQGRSTEFETWLASQLTGSQSDSLSFGLFFHPLIGSFLLNWAMGACLEVPGARLVCPFSLLLAAFCQCIFEVRCGLTDTSRLECILLIQQWVRVWDLGNGGTNSAACATVRNGLLHALTSCLRPDV